MANPRNTATRAPAMAEEVLEGESLLDDEMLKRLAAATEGWEDEQVGFPPYWNPSLGAIFLARVMGKDERDPNFVRYVLEVTQVPIPCKNGPSDDAEEVIVKPGEFFTCSAYAALPLDRFFGMEVLVTTKSKRKLPPSDESGGKPRTLWNFSVKVSPESKKALAAKREAEAKQLGAGL